MRRSGHAARRLPTKRAALRRPVRSPPQSRHEDRRTPTEPAGSVICQRTFSAVAIRNELPGRRRAAPRPACEGSPEYSFYGSGKISTLRNNFNHREHAFAKRDVMLLLHKKKRSWRERRRVLAAECLRSRARRPRAARDMAASRSLPGFCCGTTRANGLIIRGMLSLISEVISMDQMTNENTLGERSARKQHLYEITLTENHRK